MVILAAVRWLAKAAAQRAFGLLPNQGEGLNYALQRHVIRSLPASEKHVPPQVLARARSTCASTRSTAPERRGGRDVLRVRRRLGPRRSRSGSPRSACRSQVLVDIRPVVRAGARQRLARRCTSGCGASSRPRPDATCVPLGAADGHLDRRARAALRHPLPRAVRRARDRPARGLGRLHLLDGRLRAHPRARPRRDPPRVRAAAAARRPRQLPHRPHRSLQLLRQEPLALPLPPLQRPHAGAGSTRRCSSRTGCA